MHALLLPQPRLVRLLEKRARDLGVDIRWGHELTALSAGAGAVAVTVTSAERTYRVDAGYLVGALWHFAGAPLAFGVAAALMAAGTVLLARVPVAARLPEDGNR